MFTFALRTSCTILARSRIDASAQSIDVLKSIVSQLDWVYQTQIKYLLTK